MPKSTVSKLADDFDARADASPCGVTDATVAYRKAASAAREVDGKTVSDGYHTFGELYAHRRALMLVLMRSHPADSWRSREHHPADGPMFDGDFIVGIDAPTGGIRYHVGVEHWSMFDFAITLPHAPKWDGAGPDATVERLLTWRPNEWDCVAYGPEGTKVGALCFFSADLGDRDCATRGQCSRRMAAERGRIHGRIGEMAAAGDPVGVMLAEEFPTPDGLLNSDAVEPAPVASPLPRATETFPPDAILFVPHVPDLALDRLADLDGRTDIVDITDLAHDKLWRADPEREGDMPALTLNFPVGDLDQLARGRGHVVDMLGKTARPARAMTAIPDATSTYARQAIVQTGPDYPLG